MPNSSAQPGMAAQAQQTAHWTAVIGTVAVSLCLVITMIALAIVVARDGNAAEVSDALGAFVSIGKELAITISILIAGPQAVNVLLSRFFPTAPGSTTTTSSTATTQIETTRGAA